MSRRGFTLLEVLVAVVILSFSLVALFRLFSQGLDSLGRVNSYQGLLVTLSNIVEDLDRVHDFETRKEGRGQSGDLSYAWRAEPEAAPELMSLRSGTVGYYRIGLYRITVRVERPGAGDTRPLREFSFVKAGWIRG